MHYVSIGYCSRASRRTHVNHNIFSFKQTIKKNDYTIFYQVICAFLTIMQQMFALCYLGEIATSKCATTDQEMYHAKWYNYPTKIQKYTILIMMRSQQRFVFQGFSLLPCSLPAFKEVSFNSAICVCSKCFIYNILKYVFHRCYSSLRQCICYWQNSTTNIVTFIDEVDFGRCVEWWNSFHGKLCDDVSYYSSRMSRGMDFIRCYSKKNRFKFGENVFIVKNNIIKPEINSFNGDEMNMNMNR